MNVFTLVGGGVDEAVNKAELTVNLVPVDGAALQPGGVQAAPARHARGPPGRHPLGRRPADDGRRRLPPAAGAVQPPLATTGTRSSPRSEKTRAAMHAEPGPRRRGLDLPRRAGRCSRCRWTASAPRRVGLPAAAVGQTLRAFLGQDAFATYRERGDQYDVKLRLPDAVPRGPGRDRRAHPAHARGRARRAPQRRAPRARRGPVADRAPGAEAPGHDAREPRRATRSARRSAFLNGVAKDFPPTVQTDFEGQGKELGEHGPRVPPRAAPRRHPRLHDPRRAVREPARPVHDHALAAARGHRRASARCSSRASTCRCSR